MNNVINWFEIPVADMDRAVAFYEPVLQGDAASGKYGLC
ncbi:Predicted enzyme related to lactoylglutathione lyase [Raoultella terrigena]|uniref:Predicted enzyme related to lactoylglutathione lyase n=1 Tax=Raoultella terrigena TaxID=577 RepID=A0A4V6J2L0_RAOTE|nr:Predicted enzyme related to lactoylglutathione lyase [Raoultella terrigena]